jgi:hypothetical protein
MAADRRELFIAQRLKSRQQLLEADLYRLI